tara:strand:+ start:534 stop:2693 length:2160 start_codon:yes stop_codon:yes gene_type:complete
MQKVHAINKHEEISSMKNRGGWGFGVIFGLLLVSPLEPVCGKSKVDETIVHDNAEKKGLVSGRKLDDLAYLRKVSVDLIGRIPSDKEIMSYLKWPASKRRDRLVEELLKHERFADRWTAFFADMLRIRTGATGGTALLAYVHQAVEEGKPFDELARELISINGRANSAPAVGFILNDNVDPMALTGATAQVFLGIRLQCAQCHDHPFDDWEQRQFYEMASFFGKTRRVQSQLTRSVYTTEGDESNVLWPPARKKPPSRAPIDARFPFLLEKFDEKPKHILRLEAKRFAIHKVNAAQGTKADLENLLEDTEASVASVARKTGDGFDVSSELKRDNAALDIKGDLYKSSELRAELARLITHPRNRYFAQNFVNRLWAELMGRGFYEPIDDYSEYQDVSHPKTLDFLRKEFIAVGYDLREMVKLVVKTDAYARGGLPAKYSDKKRIESELAFAAGITRRMIGEALFDSIVTAGHLEDYKWPAGANLQTIKRRERVYVGKDGEEKDDEPANLYAVSSDNPSMAASKGGYNLEQSIALDFNALLSRNEVTQELETMRMRSDQELEALRMAKMATTAARGGKYKYVDIEEQVDDNPRYTSSYLMASPAPADHFLRIFGQPSRNRLGEFRNFTASMRQALMMLNGKLTHEASRIGPFEPVHKFLDGKRRDLPAAIRQTYLEIFTREPSKEEVKEGLAFLGDANGPIEGMADLRWIMLNSHEFKFLP